MDLRAGDSSATDRRLVQRLEPAFDRTGRILVPSRTVFVDARETLRRSQAARGFHIERSHSIVDDVLIALSARSIGAVVATQNERDYRAIEAIRTFQLQIVRSHGRVDLRSKMSALTWEHQ